MKVSREQLLTINALKLSGIVDKMDDTQFNEYCGALNTFIAKFPEQEAKIKGSFEAKDKVSFSADLLEVMDTLEAIHAGGLSQICFKLMSTVRAGDYDSASAQLTLFLAGISALSIDIQMAGHKDVLTPDPVTMIQDSSQQKTILAVDDVSFLLATLKGMLQNSEYKFVGVTSGAMALKFLENHRPDLFILDIEMPEMDGYELAKKIKALGHKAPIVYLTGNATADYVLKAIQSGGVDFIVKPVNKEQVLEKIRKFLG